MSLIKIGGMAVTLIVVVVGGYWGWQTWLKSKYMTTISYQQQTPAPGLVEVVEITGQADVRSHETLENGQLVTVTTETMKLKFNMGGEMLVLAPASFRVFRDRDQVWLDVVNGKVWVTSWPGIITTSHVNIASRRPGTYGVEVRPELVRVVADTAKVVAYRDNFTKDVDPGQRVELVSAGSTVAMKDLGLGVVTPAWVLPLLAK